MRTHDAQPDRKFDLLQQLGAHDRVDLHFLELFGRELSWLRDDVPRHCQLADIVQQGCAPVLSARFH
jgi:hypothetical protein